MERKKLQSLVLKATEGLMESVTDMVLYSVFYEAEALESLNMKTALTWAPWAAERQLGKINYQTIKRSVVQLIDKGLIKKNKSRLGITNKGLNRLKEILPSIGTDSKRNIGEVYLVAYDVSETTRSGRSCLRRLLKKVKAKRIQQSLFIVIVNPQRHLEELLEEIPLSGQVLVTKLGKDSLLGGKPIANFLHEAYELDQLNDRYTEFIKKFSKIKNGRLVKGMLNFSFNSIMKEDPNLPKEFLPDDWTGEKAWALFNKLHITYS